MTGKLARLVHPEYMLVTTVQLVRFDVTAGAVKPVQLPNIRPIVVTLAVLLNIGGLTIEEQKLNALYILSTASTSHASVANISILLQPQNESAKYENLIPPHCLS